jgi:hypothetical protein
MTRRTRSARQRPVRRGDIAPRPVPAGAGPALADLAHSVLEPPTLSRESAASFQSVLGNQAVMRLISGQRHVEAAPEPEDRARARRVGGRPLERGAAIGVGQLARTSALVQRRSSSGMAAATATDAFAKAAYGYWTDAANKDKPLKDLGDFLMAKVNATVPYACKHAFSATSVESGMFDRTIWTISINTAAFSKRSGVAKVSDLNKAEMAEIVDTLYHEARHSEQYFRIARTQAGRGKKAKEIETGMSIPKDVAEAAYKDPLKGDTKANKVLVAEAAMWEGITVGKYETYKGENNDLLLGAIPEMTAIFNDSGLDDGTKITRLKPVIAKLGKAMTDFFVGEQTKIEGISKPDSLDKAILKHIKKLTSAFAKLKAEYDVQAGDAKKVDLPKLTKLAAAVYQANYDAYRDYEHEKDAWLTGAAAAGAFNKLAGKKK